jgi:hypothetical protein
MACRVNPAVKGVESAGPHALGHRARGQPSAAKLGGRDHAVLAARDRRDDRVRPGWPTFV